MPCVRVRTVRALLSARNSTPPKPRRDRPRPSRRSYCASLRLRERLRVALRDGVLLRELRLRVALAEGGGAQLQPSPHVI